MRRPAGVRAMPRAAALLLLAAVSVHAQVQGSNGTGNPVTLSRRPTVPDIALDSPLGDPVFQERRLRQLALANHKAMVSDTDKLVELAAELNQEIGNANPRSFTPEQLRKIAQIEKLAHSVREKMRFSIVSPQDQMEAVPAMPRIGH